jgi:pimeloyl-ACP methyl ester carboxylesterase
MTPQLINGWAVEVQGEGPALLCIHGLGGSSNTWTPILEALIEFKVIRPDLPGSARSALAATPLSVEVYVDALERILQELAVESVHLVAHSLGSIVAQHFAVRHPGKVKSLVMFGPLAAPPDAARPNIIERAKLARTGLAGMQAIADAIVKGATSKETKESQPAVTALVRESVMRQTAEGYAQSCEALAGAQPAAVEQLSIPALLITGDEDGVASPPAVAALSARMKNSVHAVLSGCGHWTTFEKPQACMQELQAFYARVS